MGNFEKAIDYINLSIKLSKAISDQWTLSNAYLNMSLHYEMMNENKLSKVYADSSEVISFKMGLKQNLNLIHFQYYKYYNQLGDYKKALDHYITSDRYKDSVSGENIEKQINFLNAQFQSERKDKEIIRNQLVIKRQRLLIYSFIIGVLTIGGFLFWLIRLYRRLKIYNVNLAKANEYITFQKEEIISQRDEIEQQRDTVMNQKILLEHINLHLTESIEYAVNIQETMLPSSEQFSSIFPSHFIFYKPLDLVSGDFYWLHRQNNQVFFAVADCTGHGVSGAFMSLLGISFLNEIIKIKRIEKPNEILDHLRQEIIESMKQKQAIGTRRDGMDIALCVINLDTKVMDYSGANNPCWIVTKDKEVVELKPDKNPVSIYLRMQPFSLRTVQLQSNDSVYLFTDGFADQFGGPQNKRYYISNLMKFVLDHHKIELTQVKEELEKEFISWKGSNNQIDDVTILGIRV
jgi:serine phosphatase RsbU (regulator of sigma subunit)